MSQQHVIQSQLAPGQTGSESTTVFRVRMRPVQGCRSIGLTANLGAFELSRSLCKAEHCASLFPKSSRLRTLLR